MIKVIIEDETPWPFDKRDGSGQYFKQEMLCHIPDRQGRTFRKIVMQMCDTDANGKPQTYKKGTYQLAPHSVVIDKFGSMALRPALVPVDNGGK